MTHSPYVKSLATFTLLVGWLAVQSVLPAQADLSKSSSRPLRTIPDGTTIPGTGSLLVRNQNGVFMTLHTAGLTPGNAYTVWWVIFNKPNKCSGGECGPDDFVPGNPAEISVLFAAGQVAGVDGTADFSSYRAVGDISDPCSCVPPLFIGAGLQKPMSAVIHLVVHSHGPAILNDPALLQEQISTFNGGCNPGEPNEGQCEDVQFSDHRP